MGKFFGSFPIINYANNQMLDLTVRPTIDDLVVRKSLASFFPYVMRDGQRLDTLAYDYYHDADMYWLIALTNNLVDLYYDVPMNDENFYSYLQTQYGSATSAQSDAVIGWRTNGKSDSTILSVLQYDDLLPTQKKHWNPVLNGHGDPGSYVRRTDEWYVSTNRCLQMAVNRTGLKVGERLTKNGTTAAWVLSISGTTVVLNHILQTINNGDALLGTKSNVSVTVSSVPSVVSRGFSDDEIPYWSIFYAFDIEQDANNLKRNIKLLDNNLASEALVQLRRTLSE